MAQIPCTREHVLLRSQPSTRDCIPIANNPVSHYPKNQCPVPGLSPPLPSRALYPRSYNPTAQSLFASQNTFMSQIGNTVLPETRKNLFLAEKPRLSCFRSWLLYHMTYTNLLLTSLPSPPPVTQTSHTSHKSVWQSCTAPRYKSACMYGWQKAVHSFLQRFVMTHSVFHCSGPLRMRMRMRIRIRMQMQRRNGDEVSYP